MSTVNLLLNGFELALTPMNLLFALIGSILGTLIGVLPGIGPTAGIAILLPLTSYLPPTPAIIMLAAIYYGAMYGGSTTAILVNIPGEVSSVPTTFDGYQMARQGRAGPALAIAAISSFVAGTIGTLGLTFFAPLLAEVALKIGPPEYFGLMVLALSIVVSLSGESMIKGFASATFGAMVALIGMDPISGQKRFTLGNTELVAGIDFIAVIIGLFAIAEVLKNTEKETPAIYSAPLKSLLPRIKELWDCTGAILRGTAIGFFLGILPGCTPGVIGFISYDLERRVSKFKDLFGKGAIQGVAAPEAANNAATSGGFVPLLALGIPSNTALAVLLSGLMIYGLQPGPLLLEKQPQFVWTVIASMYIGNVILLILNLPLVGFWAKMVAIPYHIMGPMILLFSFIGAFSVRNSFFDIWTALFFGILGFIMDKVKIPSIPMVLSLILTSMLESALRQSMAMAFGSPLILVQRPLALAFIIAGCLLAAFSLFTRVRQSKMKEYILVGGKEAD